MCLNLVRMLIVVSIVIPCVVYVFVWLKHNKKWLKKLTKKPAQRPKCLARLFTVCKAVNSSHQVFSAGGAMVTDVLPLTLVPDVHGLPQAVGQGASKLRATQTQSNGKKTRAVTDANLAPWHNTSCTCNDDVCLAPSAGDPKHSGSTSHRQYLA